MKQSNSYLLNSEDEGATLLRNVGDHFIDHLPSLTNFILLLPTLLLRLLHFFNLLSLSLLRLLCLYFITLPICSSFLTLQSLVTGTFICKPAG